MVIKDTRRKLKASFVFFLVSVLALLVLNCGGETSETKARLNEQFELSIGQSAVISGEGLTLRLDDVTEDSRCPKGAVCIWEGRASCAVVMTYNGVNDKITLSEPGLTDQFSPVSYQQYKFSFHLTPYPEVGKQITKEEYRLQLIVSK